MGYILYEHGLKYPFLIGSDNSVGISTGFGAKGGYTHLNTSKSPQKNLKKLSQKYQEHIYVIKEQQKH